MPLRDYLKTLPFEQQVTYAMRAGTTLNYLRKVIYTDRIVGAKIAKGLDDASGGVVSRHALRPDIFGPAPEPAAKIPAYVQRPLKPRAPKRGAR